MSQSKRPYEATFIVNASLEDLQVDSIINHVQEVITRNGGEILALNKWGRKRLAYTVKKKNNGYYVNIEFTASGSIVSQLERTFLLDENILRFLTIHRDKRAIQASALAQASAVVQPENAETETPVSSREPLFVDEDTESAGNSPLLIP
jgi:small subunit ribosomal protein S6